MQLHEAEKRVVLIVDDEPQVVAALCDALEDDYRVVTAPSPEAALAILKTDKGISVIISDQRMPDMTGDQLLARAQRVSIAARVLITAYADISAVINAVNLGNIFGYISKTVAAARPRTHRPAGRRLLRAEPADGARAGIAAPTDGQQPRRDRYQGPGASLCAAERP